MADEAQKQAAAYAAQTQELFDRYAEDERLKQGYVGEMSVDLMTVPARDEERQRLDERFRELDEERKKFTEAAVRLGREKAALEVPLYVRRLVSVLLIWRFYRRNGSSSLKRNDRGKSR